VLRRTGSRAKAGATAARATNTLITTANIRAMVKAPSGHDGETHHQYGFGFRPEEIGQIARGFRFFRKEGLQSSRRQTPSQEEMNVGRGKPRLSIGRPRSKKGPGWLFSTAAEGYRLENCVPRRAPRRPYFLRSFMRPSRVSRPLWRSVSASSTSNVFRARAMPSRQAPA